MGGMSTRNEIKARLGILAEPLAKAKFGIWGDVPSQYRAAVDFIRKQGRPSVAAMNELKKAIKQRLAYAAQERDPGMRQMYQDDAGSLENALEYAQRGDKATLLRAAHNMDTAVRDDVPNEMFIWAGGDVNWSHPNVKGMLERVSRSVGASAPAKRRAMRPGVKTKMAVNRRKVVQDLEYLRDEARRVNDASSRMDAENWLKRVRARDLKEQDWLEAADAVSQISAVLNSRPGAKAKMAKTTDALMAVIEKRKRQMLDDLSESFRGPVQSTTIKPLVSPIEQSQSLIQKGDVDGAMRLLNAWAQDLMGKYRVDPQMKMVAYTANALAKSVREAIQDMKHARASRPGAKAKMARSGQRERFLRIDPRSVEQWESSAGQKIDSVGPTVWIFVDPSGKEIWLPRPMRFREAVTWLVLNEKQAKPNDYYKVAHSRPGAKATHAAADKPGRKVMAESDPAVSAKIRKLMAEGKPQKQAVAIALDMKRRGEI